MLKNNQTEAISILFVHDAEGMIDGLVDQYKEMDKVRKSQRVKQRNKIFLNHVIKDWLEEIRIESQITLEFVNYQERSSASDNSERNSVNYFTTRDLTNALRLTDLNASYNSSTTD